MKNTKIDPTSANGAKELDKAAYHALKEGLLRGEYPPGKRLVERDLADQLGMSRSPVRWALQRLETDGFLERSTKRGLSVRSISPKEALELLEIREALEGMAARLAAERRTEDDVEHFTALLHAMKNKNHQWGSPYGLARELHVAIFQAAGNATLMNMLEKVFAQSSTLSYRLLTAGKEARNTLAEHHRIVHCILKQDAAGAERHARAHMRSTKTHILRWQAATIK